MRAAAVPTRGIHRVMQWTCVLACACGACNSSPWVDSRVMVIAHRGNSRYHPENTLTAFREAGAVGADLVELDARLSADNTLYCLHDGTLDRTTDVRKVRGGEKVRMRDLPDAELARLDAGSWFDAKFAGEPLPTLADALDVIHEKSRTLLEHKDGPAEDYVRLLREKRLTNKLVVQSFDWKWLEQYHALEPKQTLAALGSKELGDEQLAKLPATGASIVAWSHADLNQEVIAKLHNLGYRVWAWTVNEPADWERLLAAGIDGIITDRPGDLRQVLCDR